ncbi:MAG: GNAT family N-acetyltransferase [Hyphomonadaceae bacterium]|nr:GNAT family N-acetyltransferase [Hyphomonadaceae bacterium]
MTELAIHPLTPDRWDDLVDLFETDSITRMCWCMVTRLSGAELREFKPADRKKMFQSLVKQGKAPGLLAYKDGEAVGWVAVAPRDMTPDWNRGRKSSAAETEADASDPACWGASCFFVRSGHRKKGMTAELLDAGIAHAKKAGAKRLEACPMSHDDKRSAVGMCVGPQRVFERAGFKTVVERKPGRPLMRLDLRTTSTRKKSAPAKKAAPKPKKARAR